MEPPIICQLQFWFSYLVTVPTVVSACAFLPWLVVFVAAHLSLLFGEHWFSQ